MVVGDIVNGISALDTLITFQPAAGVEVIITSSGMDVTTNVITLTDGVLFSGQVTSAGSNGAASEQCNTKFGITNAIYIAISAAGVGLSTSFSGIQVG